MNSLPDFLGAGTTLAMFALIVAAVMKLFQLASDVHELKDVLQDIRRNMQQHVAPSLAGAGLGRLRGPHSGGIGARGACPVFRRRFPAVGRPRQAAALPSGHLNLE